MDQYLLIPFLVGWTSINPSYFDVNYRGTRFWHTAICYLNLGVAKKLHAFGDFQPGPGADPAFWWTTPCAWQWLVLRPSRSARYRPVEGMGIDDDRWGHLERSCEILLIYSFLVDISDFWRWDYRKNIWGILEQKWDLEFSNGDLNWGGGSRNIYHLAI